MPLHSTPSDFPIDLSDLTAGRVDVACRSTTAALFRSQSIRANAEVRFSSERKTVIINGALVRYLKPDEASIAGRMMAALKRHKGQENLTPSAKKEETAPGVRVLPGGLASSLRECLGPGGSPAGAHVLLLDPDGQPVAQVMDEIR
jgi:tRNA pseudouridine-54 N-methylase